MKDQNIIVETKIRNLSYLTVMGFIIIILLIIGLYLKGSTSKTTTSTNTNNTTTTTTNEEYDISKMTKITGSDAKKLFDEKGMHILYIGRPTCGVCVKLVPELNNTIDELNVKVNYLELTSTFRTEWSGLFDKLTIKTKVNNVEGTIGELLEENGYTPIVVIIKDGKMVDGFIGYRDSETITNLINKNK